MKTLETLRPAVIGVLGYTLLFVPFAQAEMPGAFVDHHQQQQQSPAPIERRTPAPANSAGDISPEGNLAARLTNAHSLYLADMGADAGFPTTQGDGYTIFVADMRSWGRYTLVSSAAQADLVLQFQAVATVPGATQATPYFKLTFADPTTLAPLWVVTVPVTFGKHKKVDLFSQSVLGVTTQVQVLAGQAIMPDPATLPHNHHVGGWIGAGLLLGALVAIPVVVGEHSGRQSQRDFCNAHGIPLSQCAGA